MFPQQIATARKRQWRDWKRSKHIRRICVEDNFLLAWVFITPAGYAWSADIFVLRDGTDGYTRDGTDGYTMISDAEAAAEQWLQANYDSGGVNAHVGGD